MNRGGDTESIRDCDFKQGHKEGLTENVTSVKGLKT